jgi:hypothetical protein
LNTTTATVTDGTVYGVEQGTTVIRYIYTNDNGCTDSAEVSIRVDSLPNAPVASDVIACYDGMVHTANAISGTNESIVWYTESTGGNITTAPSRNIPGVTTAYASARNNVTGCESATRTEVSVTIYSIPAIDLRSENNSNALCSGSSILLYVNNPDDYASDAIYVWYDGDEEKARGINMYNYSVASAGNYSVSIIEPNGCLSVLTDTININVVDSLIIGSIHSSLGNSLVYNTSTDLTVTDVQGGMPPYIYTWYKKTEVETDWTEVYSGVNSTLTTGSLTENACYKVVVSSSDPLLTCNVGTDSICIEILQVELSLEFMDDIYSICNSTLDSISLRITNSKPGFATNVLIEFNNEGTLPALSSILIDSLSGDSDTTIVIYLPENMDNDAQSGLLKAEIISCDQNDVNPSTVYGSWKNADWTGNPTQADEDMLNLTIYPDMRLESQLTNTICSGETFTYIPESNNASVKFSWVRYSTPGINEPYNSGTGAINEVLTNNYDVPVTAVYTFTLESEYCWSYITVDVEVIVLPAGELKLKINPENGSKIVLGTPITVTAILEGASTDEYTFMYFNEVKRQSHNWTEIYSFNARAMNEVEVQVKTQYGCLLTAKGSFMADYNLPNIITPNENRNNRLLPGYDIQVFNRWGSQLYRGTDGWDGRYRGALVTSGTYFYVVHFTQPDGKPWEFKRSVFVKY